LRCSDPQGNQFAVKVIKNDKNFSDEKVENILFKEYYVSEVLCGHPNILR